MKIENLSKDELDFIYQNQYLTENEIDKVIKNRLETDNFFKSQPFSAKLYSFAVKLKKTDILNYYIQLYLDQLTPTQIQSFFRLAEVANVKTAINLIKDQSVEINTKCLLYIVQKELTSDEFERFLLPLNSFNLTERLESSDYLAILKVFTEATQYRLMPLLDNEHLAAYLSHKNKYLRSRAKALLELDVMDDSLLVEITNWLAKSPPKTSNKNSYQDIQRIIEQYKGTYWMKKKPQKTPKPWWQGIPNNVSWGFPNDNVSWGDTWINSGTSTTVNVSDDVISATNLTYTDDTSNTWITIKSDSGSTC